MYTAIYSPERKGDSQNIEPLDNILYKKSSLVVNYVQSPSKAK